MERPPREPAAITLADLLVLVVGVAVVATIPWSSWLHPTDFLGPWPHWLPYLQATRQVLGMACLALIPVVLIRRARYGGLARPAEFLAACCALPFLAESLELLLLRTWVRMRTGIVITRLRDGMPVSLDKPWREGPYLTWKYSLLAAAALAMVAFLLGRRRLPGWLLTTLLLIAWLGTYHAGPELMWRDILRPILRWLPSSVWDYNSNLIPSVISALTRQPLRFLLFAVPALVAIRDLRRPRPGRRSWLEWTCLGLAAILLLISETSYHALEYFRSSGSRTWLRETLFRDLAMLATIALGIPIARRIGPAWSRLEMPRYTDATGETGSTVL